MHRRLALRARQAALNIAPRATHRASVRTLRHHAARARRIALPQTHHHEERGLLRAWLQALVRTLDMKHAAKRFSLRALLRRPLRRRRSASPLAANAATGGTRPLSSRRPRRLAPSAGWFGFGFGSR